MNKQILPSQASGIAKAPPSKSMAHRMLICSGLSKGNSLVSGIAPSEDVLATLDCLEALGASYTYDGNTVSITGTDLSSVSENTILPCRECGSTLRFFIPIALLTGKSIYMTGSERLLSRPLTVYEQICNEQNLLFESVDSKLHFNGKLTSGEYTVKGNISSQFISGLLFTLPLVDGNSMIRLLPPVESRSYIDMTIQALSIFGVKAHWLDENTIEIPGNQVYSPQNVSVEGDYSNAAFLDAFNYIGGHVTIENLNPDSLQGDKIYKQYFDQLNKGYCTLDISNCPDLGPILFAVAACKQGACFTGTKRLRIKESDRGQAMQEELEKFGIHISIFDNQIIIPDEPLKVPNTILDGHNDHRIVMTMSVLASITGGIISGVEAVRKSYPDYFEQLTSLGININTIAEDTVL